MLDLDVMSPAAAPPVSWSARLAPFRKPDLARSVWQLSSTFVLFVAGWSLMYASLRLPYWITLLLAVPTGFMIVRLFIIQHDCGHGAFFKSARAADVVGRLIGVLTMTPYSYWKRTHAMHHASSGNLDHRGFGDINTLTVREYFALTRWERLKYRLYRHPLILFVIGPSFHFMLVHRLPGIVPREWRRERRSILWTNAGLAAFVIGMGLLVGFKAFLLVHLPLMALTASLGVWMFYVQHQFEPAYWEHDEGWSYDAAALEGSSHYELPRLLQWLTGNIGLHHIHHLNARIPNYRLQRVLEEVPELQSVTRITLWQSIRCASLALWDEQTRMLVPFRKGRGQGPRAAGLGGAPRYGGQGFSPASLARSCTSGGLQPLTTFSNGRAIVGAHDEPPYGRRTRAPKARMRRVRAMSVFTSRIIQPASQMRVSKSYEAHDRSSRNPRGVERNRYSPKVPSGNCITSMCTSRLVFRLGLAETAGRNKQRTGLRPGVRSCAFACKARCGCGQSGRAGPASSPEHVVAHGHVPEPRGCS